MGVRKCALDSSAFEALFHCYAKRDEYVLQHRKAGKKVVGMLGYAVPEELVIAAGMQPVRVCARTPALNVADQYLEYSFAPLSRAKFERLADGTYDALVDYLAVADSADVENRLYYYLREMRRTEPERKIPEICVIDWLFSRHMMYQTWNERAIARFLAQLELWCGHGIEQADIRAACALCNENRAALREFDRLRTEENRIYGSEALVVIGAGFFMDKKEHTRLVKAVTEDAKAWPVLETNRIFYTGGDQEELGIYEAAEQAGLNIIAEDHHWGARSFERDIPMNIGPIRGVTDRYMLASPTAQKGLAAECTAALCAKVSNCGADGVLFYHYEYEEAASWDYPSQKQALDGMGIPSVLMNKMKYPATCNAALQEELVKAAQEIGRCTAWQKN